jgi:serine/threonine protein kinase
MAAKPSFSESDTSATPGSRIAGYEVVRLIGRGGMSEVYEAIQMGTRRPIALKLLGGKQARDPRYIQRLQREGFALARIRHPNVVVVYDAGVTDDGQAWIAMDLLEGQSLRELLVARGRLPLPQALAYAGAIFDGLEAAHRLGIIHRDVKPENIFLGVDGGLKIVDFGNAKLLNYGLKSTDPHKVFGTAAYMSPEQLGFRTSVGPRSDLYSVGLILYEMLRGRHAFSEGPDPYDLPPSIELCRMQIEDNPPHLAQVEPRIPTFVSDFVARLMAKDPDLRPASAFLAAREIRDMHDFVLREAHGKGLAPAAITIAPSTPVQERIAVPKRPPSKRARERGGSRGRAGQTGVAMLVGAILGATIFAILFFSRRHSLEPASAENAATLALHHEAVSGLQKAVAAPPLEHEPPSIDPQVASITTNTLAPASAAPVDSASVVTAPEKPTGNAPTSAGPSATSTSTEHAPRVARAHAKQFAAPSADPYAPIF